MRWGHAFTFAGLIAAGMGSYLALLYLSIGFFIYAGCIGSRDA